MKAPALHSPLKKLTLFALAAIVVAIVATTAHAQAPSQLSLADILIGLRSKKVELPDRNKILTEAVLSRGITFALTPEIEKELESTGADSGLVNAIRKKNLIVKTSATTNPPVEQKPVATPVQDFAFFMKRAESGVVKGDMDAALVDFGKAIELKPDSFDAYFERGMAYMNKKATELAVTDLSKAVELNPNSAAAWATRGDAFEKKGDAAKAKADYQKAVALDANVEPAKTNLSKIVAEELRLAKEAEDARIAAETKRLAEAAKKVAPEFVDLGQIYPTLATKMVMPVYPSTALRAGIEGKVKVEVSIDEEGNVTSAKAVEGHSFLKGAAEEAARRTKFKPAQFDGKPIKSKGYFVYNFSPTGK